MAFGSAASAKKRLGNQLWGGLFPHRFQTGGTVEIELENFPMHRAPTSPRDAQAQLGHNGFVRDQLRSLSSSEPEFLGYADDNHKLAQRDFGTHPLLPMFQFNHSTHGSMEITTRDTHNGTFFTLARAGQSTHLMGRQQLDELHAKVKRQEVYAHELLKEGTMEFAIRPKGVAG